MYLCVGVGRPEDKWPNSLITSAGPGEYRQQENRGGQSGQTWLWFLPLSSFPFLPSCMSLTHTLPTAFSPPLRDIGRLLSQWKRKWIGAGGGVLSTLTQLVRLIKRVCGLRVKAQTHKETGRLKTSLCYINMLRSILKSLQDIQ